MFASVLHLNGYPFAPVKYHYKGTFCSTGDTTHKLYTLTANINLCMLISSWRYSCSDNLLHPVIVLIIEHYDCSLAIYLCLYISMSFPTILPFSFIECFTFYAVYFQIINFTSVYAVIYPFNIYMIFCGIVDFNSKLRRS